MGVRLDWVFCYECMMARLGPMRMVKSVIGSIFVFVCGGLGFSVRVGAFGLGGV